MASRNGGSDNRTITLFVGNLSPRMRWRGLRQAFGYHENVIDSFVANKRDRHGKRFGFVRFSNRWDANRAIERLNGFILYGSHMSVSIARYGSMLTYWQKVRPIVNPNHEHNSGRWGQTNNKGGKFRKKHDVENKNVNAEEKEENNSIEIKTRNRKKGEKGECSLLNEERKKLVRHVKNEDLWKFKKCLVDKMATVCSVQSIMNKLDAWGLGEIRVKRMGGKMFLLSIEDDDLYIMLEDVKWSYLREIFEEVSPWSENFKQIERTTWLEAS
ncbi:hypothetical protein V6N13_065464 [Hibiscus sabdariffa]